MLRSKLVFYFEVHGLNEAEDLAHDVIVRVLRRLNEGLEIDSTDLVKYCFGVARHVLQEARKSRQEVPLEDVPEPEVTSIGLGGLSQVEMLVLQQQILDRLSPSERDLLMRYYLEDHNTLASDLRLTPNALRIRVHRLLEQVRDVTKR